MQAETLRTLMEIDRELITVCEAGQNGILTAAEVETRFETLRAERLRREFFLLEIGGRRPETMTAKQKEAVRRALAIRFQVVNVTLADVESEYETLRRLGIDGISGNGLREAVNACFGRAGVDPTGDHGGKDL